MSEGCGCGELLAGPDVKAGIAYVGRRLKSVMYTVVDGDDAVVEGCIILGSAKEIEKHTAMLGTESFGVAVKDPRYLWPGKEVAYQIAPDLWNPQRVIDAIAHWREHTSLRFTERTAANAHLYPNYVTFRTGLGCSSSVGCQRGEQFVKLATGCTTGNVIHEIGHAVGLFHEQSRADRDQHIEIRYQNVDPIYRHNFNQHIRDGQDIGTYDFASIMHYPGNAFSVNDQPTIIPKNGADIGQRVALSQGDIATIEALYAGI